LVTAFRSAGILACVNVRGDVRLPAHGQLSREQLSREQLSHEQLNLR